MATTKKSKKAITPARLWLVRGMLAVFIGLSIGAGGGVFSVHKLEPGRGTGVDSLQVMLDSIAKGRIAKSTAERTAKDTQRRVDSTQEAATFAADSTAEKASQELVFVPSVIDLEEGTARNAILDAGLQVGEVQFQASPKPAGTVLGTFPVSGAQVPTLTAVTLVLSDGRPPSSPENRADSLSRAPLIPTP